MESHTEEVQAKVRDTKKILKTAAIALGIALLAAASLYWAAWGALNRVEGNAKSVIERGLGCRLEVGSTAITRSFRIILSDISGRDPESKLPLPDFTAERIALAVDIPALLGGKIEVREVFVDGVMLRIYREPDGVFNFERWTKRAGKCDYDAFLKKFPRRINISGGDIVLEPIPGGRMFESMKVAAFSGAMGVTKDGEIGMILDADAVKSALRVEGGFMPCESQMLEVSAVSDAFDFTGARDMIYKITGEKNAERYLPTGGGRLSLALKGSLDAAALEGSAETRDFDADFSYSGGTLSVRNFNAGIGRKRVSGSGEIELNKKDFPYRIALRLENMSLEEMTSEKFANGLAPAGNFSAMMDISGSLESGAGKIENGSMTIENGVIRFPVPATGKDEGSKIAEIPFSRVVGDISSSNGKIRITDIDAEGEGWTGGGAAQFNTGSPVNIFDAETGYSIKMKLESDDITALAKRIPKLDGKLGGSMVATVSISGKVGDFSNISGGGTFNMTKGFAKSPYDIPGLESGQPIEFDLASASFDISSGKFRIKRYDLKGEGLAVAGAGWAGFDGDIMIAARANLSPERAAKFSGLDLAGGDGDEKVVAYEAECSISGSISRPISRWSSPVAIHAPEESRQPNE